MLGIALFPKVSSWSLPGVDNYVAQVFTIHVAIRKKFDDPCGANATNQSPVKSIVMKFLSVQEKCRRIAVPRMIGPMQESGINKSYPRQYGPE
jgi:hypothetical protein